MTTLLPKAIPIFQHVIFCLYLYLWYLIPLITSCHLVTFTLVTWFLGMKINQFLRKGSWSTVFCHFYWRSLLRNYVKNKWSALKFSLKFRVSCYIYKFTVYPQLARFQICTWLLFTENMIVCMKFLESVINGQRKQVKNVKGSVNNHPW